MVLTRNKIRTQPFIMLVQNLLLFLFLDMVAVSHSCRWKSGHFLHHNCHIQTWRKKKISIFQSVNWAGGGWEGGGGKRSCAPSSFGISVTPFGPRGAHYARHSTTAPPPSFRTMRHLCIIHFFHVLGPLVFFLSFWVPSIVHLHCMGAVEGHQQINWC